MTRGESTYQCIGEAHGKGAFFLTDCCNNRMYSVNNDPMTYHGCLCPKCFWKNKYITLYLRDTEEGRRVLSSKELTDDKDNT